MSAPDLETCERALRYLSVRLYAAKSFKEEKDTLALIDRWLDFLLQAVDDTPSSGVPSQDPNTGEIYDQDQGSPVSSGY